MSDLKKQFEIAQEEVTQLSERPDNNTLLKLYALYKQATDGDITGDRPSGCRVGGETEGPLILEGQQKISRTMARDYAIKN